MDFDDVWMRAVNDACDGIYVQRVRVRRRLPEDELV